MQEKQHIFKCGSVCKQLVCRPENAIFQTLGSSEIEKFHPVIVLLWFLNFNISAIHVSGNIPNVKIFWLQALDMKAQVFILNTISFKNKQ